MQKLLRYLLLSLTIGGGYLGVAATTDVLMTSGQSYPLLPWVLSAFFAFYGCAILTGLRLADRIAQPVLLPLVFLIQVPWVSSSLVTFSVTSGLHFTVFYSDRFSLLYAFGSEWTFSMGDRAPTGFGINFFALAMALVALALRRHKLPGSAVTLTTPSVVRESPQP